MDVTWVVCLRSSLIKLWADKQCSTGVIWKTTWERFFIMLFLYFPSKTVIGEQSCLLWHNVFLLKKKQQVPDTCSLLFMDLTVVTSQLQMCVWTLKASKRKAVLRSTYLESQDSDQKLINWILSFHLTTVKFQFFTLHIRRILQASLCGL